MLPSNNFDLDEGDSPCCFVGPLNLKSSKNDYFFSNKPLLSFPSIPTFPWGSKDARTFGNFPHAIATYLS